MIQKIGGLQVGTFMIGKKLVQQKRPESNFCAKYIWSSLRSSSRCTAYYYFFSTGFV